MLNNMKANHSIDAQENKQRKDFGFIAWWLANRNRLYFQRLLFYG